MSKLDSPLRRSLNGILPMQPGDSPGKVNPSSGKIRNSPRLPQSGLISISETRKLLLIGEGLAERFLEEAPATGTKWFNLEGSPNTTEDQSEARPNREP